MPLPKPKVGQEKNAFISACIGDEKMISEFPEQKQRIAVCNSQWQKFSDDENVQTFYNTYNGTEPVIQNEMNGLNEEIQETLDNIVNFDDPEVIDGDDVIKEFKEFKKKNVYDIDDVEIFSVGKWNGDEYTEQDLDDIVKAFNEIGGQIKPFLKLGHDNKQKLIQEDGLPSAGWITKLKRKGNKLVATFSNIPKKIKELIDKKAYGRISSEIYWNVKINNKNYRRALKAVALLGANTPAVNSLDDWVDLYTEDEKKNYEKVEYINYYIGESSMSEELVKRLEEEETSSGGIIIPDTAKEKTQFGEIIAVGTGKVSQDGTLKPLTVKAGDKVLLGKYSGTEVKFDSQEYLIVKEEEILGIIK